MSNSESGNSHLFMEGLQDLRSYLIKKRENKQRPQSSDFVDHNKHLISYNVTSSKLEKANQDVTKSSRNGYDDQENILKTSVHDVDQFVVKSPVGYRDASEDVVESFVEYHDVNEDGTNLSTVHHDTNEGDLKSSFNHHDVNEVIKSSIDFYDDDENTAKSFVDYHSENEDAKKVQCDQDKTENVEDTKSLVDEKGSGSREIASKMASKGELRDNHNPKWVDVVKMFENDKHKLLGYRWKTSTLANPKRNMTVLSYASKISNHRLESPIRLDSISEDATNPSDDHDEDGPPAKKPRRQNCTIVIERVLDDLNKRLAVLKKALAGKKVMGLLGDRPEPMKMSRRTQKYKNLIKEREVHKVFEDSRLTRALNGLTGQIDRLRKTRNEMLHFHRFYDHSSPQQEASLLDEDEVEDLLSTEAVLLAYRDAYGV